MEKTLPKAEISLEDKKDNIDQKNDEERQEKTTKDFQSHVNKFKSKAIFAVKKYRKELALVLGLGIFVTVLYKTTRSKVPVHTPFSAEDKKTMEAKEKMAKDIRDDLLQHTEIGRKFKQAQTKFNEALASGMNIPRYQQKFIMAGAAFDKLYKQKIEEIKQSK